MITLQDATNLSEIDTTTKNKTLKTTYLAFKLHQ